MKITKKQLRRLIREAIIAEAGYPTSYGRRPGEVSYKAGDIILQRSFTGDRYIKVEYREENIKNGKPGFEGEEVIFDDKTSQWVPVKSDWPEQSGVWGYDDQVTHVEEPA